MFNIEQFKIKLFNFKLFVFCKRGEKMIENCIMQDAIGPEIKATNHLIQRQMVENGACEGLDKIALMHGWILAYLYHNVDNDVFQKDIENDFSISRSAVTSIVKLMEEKGYIQRVSVENDARLKKILLTQKGMSVKSSIDKINEKNEQCLSSVFSSEEKETFLYLIRKLRKGLEKNNNNFSEMR